MNDPLQAGRSCMYGTIKAGALHRSTPRFVYLIQLP